MRILVTGIAAYAGYYAALRFAAAGHAVSGVVRRPDQPRLAFLRMHGIELLVGDVSRPETYAAALDRSHVVVHTMLDKVNPRETDRALFGAVAALPKHAGAHRRFIYTTGCSIFGKLAETTMDESTEPNPEHALAFRRGLELEALALEVGTVVLRPGFMYGNDGYNSMATDWFEMGEAGDPYFGGDREKGWSWVHIDDLAEAYLRVAEADRSIDGEVFCVADANRPRSLEVMRACLDAAGYRGEVAYGPPRKGDNASTWFNQNEFITSDKARRVLGWIPRHRGVLEGIPAAYAGWKAGQALLG
jgi:nucleoside-diphosphate-sugar epimerase